MPRLRIPTTLALAAALGLAAVAGASAAAPAGTLANPVRATTSPTRGFGPVRVTAAPGATVHFRNIDHARHSAIEDAVLGRPAFSSGRPTRHDFTLRAPRARGTYSYICAVHGYMRGTLIVR